MEIIYNELTKGYIALSYVEFYYLMIGSFIGLTLGAFITFVVKK